MNLKEFLLEEGGANISIQFYDEYDRKNDKINKKASYSQNGKEKVFNLEDLQDNVPDGVLKSMKKAILKNTGVNLENISDFKKYAGQNFKYKDGDYDISFTITGQGEKQRGTSNVDHKEIEKAKKGRKSEAESQQELEKRNKTPANIKGASSKAKEKIRKKQHDVLSREIAANKKNRR